MINAVSETILPLVDGADARAALYVFAPTRSRIIDAQIIDCSRIEVPKDELPLDIHIAGPALALNAMDGFVHSDRKVMLRIRHEGESLRLIDASSQDQALEAVDAQARTEGILCDRLRSLEAMAMADLDMGDPRGLMFYRLEKACNTSYMCCDMSAENETERRARVLSIETARGQLWRRVQERHVRSDVSRVSIDVGYISRMFREAIAPFGIDRPFEKAGKAFEDFAAGWLQRFVRIPSRPTSRPQIEVDPDSDYVFLFAEMAFAALEDEALDEEYAAMWNALLPHLVHMQLLYLTRLEKIGPLGTNVRPERLDWLQLIKRNNLEHLRPDRDHCEARMLEHLNLTNQRECER